MHPGLLGRDNVVLLPHIGSATVETRTAMADLAVANVLAVLAGNDPVTAVNRSRAEPVPARCGRPVRRNSSRAFVRTVRGPGARGR